MEVNQEAGRYANAFAFDPDGNRAQETLDTNGDGTVDDTIHYTYNSDNQLGTETETRNSDLSTVYAVTYGYDNAGNLTSQVRTGTNAESDTYTWDLRGRMISATVNGVPTTYTYDTNAIRTSETTGSAATYYLNDPNNPTGYTKAVEESTTKRGTPSRSFIFGLQVEGQAKSGDPNGPLFLLHDGHGNTRALLNITGGVVEQYNDDAYGNLLASNGAQASPANALTPWLEPDGLYDPASGWNYNLARWRDGFHWTSMDPTVFSPGQLADANLYSYLGGRPIQLQDASGHAGLIDSVVTMSLNVILQGIRIGLPVYRVAHPFIAGLTLYAFARDPQAFQDFIASGGNPAEAVEGLLATPGLLASDAKNLLAFGRGLLEDAQALRIDSSAVASLRGALNKLSGTLFERDVFAALGLTEENREWLWGGHVPDLPPGLRFGIADIKDVLDLKADAQLRSFAETAENNHLPFNLIISPRTLKVATELQEFVRDTGGKIFEFDPEKALWFVRQFSGTNVVR